jgi:hypothetical protein
MPYSRLAKHVKADSHKEASSFDIMLMRFWCYEHYHSQLCYGSLFSSRHPSFLLFCVFSPCLPAAFTRLLWRRIHGYDVFSTRPAYLNLPLRGRMKASILLCVATILAVLFLISTPPHAVAQTPQHRYAIAYDASNTLRFVVLRSHCVVVDLDVLFAQRLGYTGTIIFDGTAALGQLWRGDIAVDSSSDVDDHRGHQLQALTRGSSLDYGAGTISYCPPLLQHAQETPEEEVTSDATLVVNDTVALRFTPTPVTPDHPVQPYQLLLSTVPLTFEPVSPVVSMRIDGWEWFDDEEEVGETRPATPPDAPAGPSLRNDESYVVPIAVGLQPELQQHWRPARTGDVVRYTPRPAIASLDGTSTMSGNVSATEPRMDEYVEAIELFSESNRTDWSPCQLYAVSADHPAAGDARGDDDDFDPPQRINASPFPFPPSTQIRLRVNLTKSEVRAAMQTWALATSVTAAQNVSAGVAAGRTIPPLCSIGFRVRQRRGSIDSAASPVQGSVKVEWAPAPRTVIEARNIVLFPHPAMHILHVSARMVVRSGTSASVFSMNRLCLAGPPHTPNLNLSVSSYPHCVSCTADALTCRMGIPYSYQRIENHTATTSANEVYSMFSRHDGLGNTVSGASTNVSETAPPLNWSRTSVLDFFTVSVHRAVKGEYISGATQVKVHVLSEHLCDLLATQLRVTSKTVHINQTRQVPFVVDLSTAVPGFLRPFVETTMIRSISINRLHGQLYIQAETASSSSETRRGLQWKRLLPSRYWDPADEEKAEATDAVDEQHGTSRVVKLRDQPTLLRYIPPVSWLSAMSCAATATAAATAQPLTDEVLLDTQFAFFGVGRTRLSFEMAVPPTCPPRTSAPTEKGVRRGNGGGDGGWWQPTDALPTITAHRFVYQHTANPIQLHLTKQSHRGGNSPAALERLFFSQPPQAIRFVSLPSRGTVSRLPSCINLENESEWLLGHCEAVTSHPPLDAEVGCMCCFQDCSTYVKDPLSSGAVLEAERLAVSSSLEWFTPFWVFYTPTPSASSKGSVDEKSEEEVEVEEEVMAIRYTVWPPRYPMQLYEILLHVRRWPETSLRPSFLMPLAPGAELGFAPPPPLPAAQSPQLVTSLHKNPYRVLRMSTRADVETGLMGGNPDNATTRLPLHVFDCVPLRSDSTPGRAGGRSLLRASYTRSRAPLEPTWKFGVLAFWPSLTRGCLVLEAGDALPTLLVHAVRLLKGDEPSFAASASSDARGGFAAGSVADAATVQIQPYASALRDRVVLTWAPQVDAESPQWSFMVSNASALVRIRVPKPWGFYRAGETIQPYLLTLRFFRNEEKEEGEASGVYVRLSRAPRRGCVLQPPNPHCLQPGSPFTAVPCDKTPRNTNTRPSFPQPWCLPLTYMLQRMERHRPVRMRDVLEFAAVTSDGEQIGKPLVVSLVGTRPVLGGYSKQIALSLLALLLVAVIMTPKRTQRWLTRRLVGVQRHFCCRRRIKKKPRGERNDYEMVNKHDDATQEAS